VRLANQKINNMDYKDLLSTLRYIGETSPAVLGGQLVEEIASYKPSSTNSVSDNTKEATMEQKVSPGVAMTPEVVKELETKKQALIQKRMDLERKRRMDEYDQRAQARGLRVKDTLEKIGLGK